MKLYKKLLSITDRNEFIKTLRNARKDRNKQCKQYVNFVVL